MRQSMRLNYVLRLSIACALIFFISEFVSGQDRTLENNCDNADFGSVCQYSDGSIHDQLVATARKYADRTAARQMRQAQSRSGEIPSVFDLRVFVDEALTTEGLTGSYIDENLRGYQIQDDWRISQAIAGTRIDSAINFITTSWGERSEVGLTSGSDANWENFSAQWDGYLQVTDPGMSIQFRSDDGSRMWIDLNRDGIFEESGNEFIDNGWGNGQAATLSEASVPLPAGVYPVRIQYEEGSGGNIMQLVTGPPYVLRIGYLIPSNRSPQSEGVKNLSWVAIQLQDLFREQMDRNGFGEKTIRLETEEDGVTPIVHVVSLQDSDDYYRADDNDNDALTMWSRVLEDAGNAGVTVFADGEVWMLVFEAHLQLQDGSIIGDLALGAGLDNRSGVGMLDSDVLSLMDPAGTTDNRIYDGLLIPEIGPYPLVQGVSFSAFGGTTISSVVSSSTGAIFHEVSHGFGLPHDFRNDSNFSGNMMGNGFRGYRAYLYPDLYPENEMRVSYASSLRLNASRFFGAPPVENDDPEIDLWGVNPTPVNGKINIRYSLTDNSGLASATLIRNGNFEGEINLTGPTSSGTIETSRYSVGKSNRFELVLVDRHGNGTSESLDVVPDSGFNRAPEPFIRIRPTNPWVGETMVLDAGFSIDRDHSENALTYEWDLDGDGEFDTPPVGDPAYPVRYMVQGPRLIRVRITDPAGADTVSTPVAIRVNDVISSDGFEQAKRGLP